MEREKDLLILNPILAKSLLSMGYKIVNIGQNEQDKQRTVFFFKRENGIEEVLSRLIQQAKTR